MKRVQRASGAAVAALAAVTVLSPAAANAGTGQLLNVTGSGSTTAGAYHLRVSAHLADLRTFGTWETWDHAGLVDQVVPPAGDRDYYCISGPVTDGSGGRMNIYIRDSGNGRTSFDQWQTAAGGPTISCSSLPDQLSPWQTLDSGNFKVSGSASRT